MLYYAPAGTSVINWTDWVPMGAAESCQMTLADDPLTDALLGFDLHGRCASVSFSVDRMSACSYWALFRQRHPKIGDMHRAYRRKTRRR